MSGEYQTSAHTTHRCKYHLVWCPKYRKRVLRGELAARLHTLFNQCADVNGWFIEELAVQPDHIHMLVRLKPSVSVSDAVNLLKGGSSRIVRQEFPELEEFLWGDSLWADGYFVETIGQVNEEIIRAYIQNQ